MTDDIQIAEGLIDWDKCRKKRTRDRDINARRRAAGYYRQRYKLHAFKLKLKRCGVKLQDQPGAD